MKTYELTYIISPEMTSQEAEDKAKEIESAVQGKEGTIIKQSNPVAKTLSYPIKKRASGFFGFLEFQLEPEKLVELKNVLSKDGKITRHMVIIKEAAEFKKARRTRGLLKTKPVPAIEAEKKTEPEAAKEEKSGKVELKDIEQKLDELLGE